MSEQTGQKEATYNAIHSVLEAKGISFEDGSNVSEVLNTELKKEAKTILFEGIRSETVACSKQHIIDSDTKLNTYCNGLISNWTKKDKRFNGNVQHKAINPGSRAGQGDEQVKELRKLLKQVAGTDAVAQVQVALDTRVAEVKAAKTPALVINAKSIPEHLRKFIK